MTTPTLPQLPSHHAWPFNRLLARMPPELLQAWHGQLELVTLRQNQNLYAPPQGPGWVYFPLTALISLAYTFDNGKTASIAVTGYEGLVGLSRLVEHASLSRFAKVEIAGQAWRLPGRLARETLLREPQGMALLMRYMHSMLVQIGQIGLCRGEHSLLQRLSRLLLMCDDRLPWQELALTQQRLSDMMGLRREGITRALNQLSDQRLIETRRGHLRLLDREGLQACSCECYRESRLEIGWLLETVPSPAALLMPTPAAGGSRNG